YRAQLLGGLRIWKENQEVTGWRSERTRALLAYLLLHSDRDLHRTQVAEAIWYLPDTDEEPALWVPEKARAYLSRELYELRRMLGWQEENGISPLRTTRHLIRLDSRLISTDAALFRALVFRIKRVRTDEKRKILLQEALSFARERGPLLPDIQYEWA